MKRRLPLQWGGDHLYCWQEKAFSAEQMRALAHSLSSVDPVVCAADARVGWHICAHVRDHALAIGSTGPSSPSQDLDRKTSCLNQMEEGDRRCVPWEVF